MEKKKIIAGTTDDLFILPVSRRHEFYTKNFLCKRIGSMKFVVGGIRKDEDGTIFAPLDKDVLNAIGIDEKKLMQKAIENMATVAPLMVMDILDAMKIFAPDELLTEDHIANALPGCTKMIIVTNENTRFGSASILYPGAMKQVSDTCFDGKGFYIMPSSVHEVICVPDDGAIDGDAMQMMVIDINRSVVGTEDYLSDQVYFYDPVNDEVTVEEE